MYHGHRKTNCEDIRMSFQLLSDSLPCNGPFEDSATKHLCLPSCTKCISNKFQGDMKLIDTETSLLKDKYIDSLLDGSFVLGNLDLVGWVIIKNSFKSEKMSMQPLKKLKDLRDFKKKMDRRR